MPDAADPGGISVRGHGETFAEPDTALIDVGVQVIAPTVAEARERGANVARRVIDAVIAAGIDARDVGTSSLLLNPHYEHSRDEGSKLAGYELGNTVTVRIRHIDIVSKVIDDAVAAGGDDVRLNALRFIRENVADLSDQARANAMADARDRAEQLARLAGVGLGRPLSIVEAPPTSGAPQPRMMMATADAGAATPIEPGATRIAIDLEVRYAIER